MFTTPYIDGAAIEIPLADLTDVVNPASRLPFAKVFMAQPDHMRKAIDAAYAANDAWGKRWPRSASWFCCERPTLWRVLVRKL